MPKVTVLGFVDFERGVWERKFVTKQYKARGRGRRERWAVRNKSTICQASGPSNTLFYFIFLSTKTGYGVKG